jgi:hypothetical protein
LDDDAGWGCSITSWDKERLSRLLAGDALGADVEQLLCGVPDKVIQCWEVRRLLHIVHAAPGCIYPLSLRTMAISFLVPVSPPPDVGSTRGIHDVRPSPPSEPGSALGVP